MGLSRRQNVYPADVALVFPVAKAGKRRKYHIPDQPPVSAEAALANVKWQKVSWRRGTKGRLTCLFAARRVRVADGHKHRMRDNRMQCTPGRRGLARWRTPVDRRTKILCVELAGRCEPEKARCDNQGPVGL
nr:Transposase-like protein [Methylocystis sp. SC2]